MLTEHIMALHAGKKSINSNASRSADWRNSSLVSSSEENENTLK